MTIKEAVQLAFALSNVLSFVLTFRPSWRTKLAGSLVLVVAHPGVAVYFALTGQPFFIVGNVFMAAAGCYGTWRALRLRRQESRNEAIAAAVREGWTKGVARVEGPLTRALQQAAKDLDRRA